MDQMLILLAQADVDRVARQARSWYATAVAAARQYWYVSIPAAFVLCFVIAVGFAKWKWSKV